VSLGEGSEGAGCLRGKSGKLLCVVLIGHGVVAEASSIESQRFHTMIAADHKAEPHPHSTVISQDGWDWSTAPSAAGEHFRTESASWCGSRSWSWRGSTVTCSQVRPSSSLAEQISLMRRILAGEGLFKPSSPPEPINLAKLIELTNWLGRATAKCNLDESYVDHHLSPAQHAPQQLVSLPHYPSQKATMSCICLP